MSPSEETTQNVVPITAENLLLLRWMSDTDYGSNPTYKSSSDSDGSNVRPHANYRLPSYSDFSPWNTVTEESLNTLNEQLAALDPGEDYEYNGDDYPETQSSNEILSLGSSKSIATISAWPKIDNDGITPDDSVSVRGAPQEDYSNEPDAWAQQVSDESSSEAVFGGNHEDNEYEDNLTKMGNIHRMPDINGTPHYRLELDVDKHLNDNKVYNNSFEVDLHHCGLSVINHNRQYPDSASDIEIFKNDKIEVKKSPMAGYGVFAVCDLEPFTPILVEHELFQGTLYDIYDKYEALTEEQKKAYNKLHGHKRTPTTDTRAAIWHTNHFSIEGKGCLFLVGSRFNHACRPNVQYHYDKDRKVMLFTTKSRVRAGQELFIRYTSDPEKMFVVWGFRCECGICKGAPAELIHALDPAAPWEPEERARAIAILSTDGPRMFEW